MPTLLVEESTAKVGVSHIKSPVPPVSAVSVPTEVSELVTTVLLRVVFDKVFASAVTVIADDPLKLTPFILLAVAKVVAVEANATAIFAVPSKDVPPIVLAVANAVAVDALPVTAPVRPPVKVPAIAPPLIMALLARLMSPDIVPPASSR